MRFIAEENITAEGSRVFGEITSSTWFQLVSEETKQSDWDRYWFRFFDFVIELFFCAGYQLPIVVIPYSDSTQVISWKRRTEHPIYVTLGNLPLQERESQSGKRLWGFIPDIDSLDFPEMRDDEIATLRRWVMAQSLQHLFARIKENRKLKTMGGRSCSVSLTRPFKQPRCVSLCLLAKPCFWNLSLVRIWETTRK